MVEYLVQLYVKAFCTMTAKKLFWGRKKINRACFHTAFKFAHNK